MNPFFPDIKKKFGFGCMRLPLIGEEVDLPQTIQMVDLFLSRGFNYFDTAHGYLGGRSETALRAALTSRHSRDEYILTNKLTATFFKTQEDIRPFFQSQLEACGVDYFDFYLMHAMSSENHQHFLDCHAYETALELKAEGKIRHVGMSFHDSARVLEEILTGWPEIEVVQLQFNYVDYEDPNVESRKCYEVCRKLGKPVIVMEPVRGGSLANLPPKATALMTSGSPASYALRFAAGFDNIMMVLSGMSTTGQMEDNLSFMADCKKLTEEELEVIDQVRAIYQAEHRIPCTNCRYCVDGCPAGIAIPDVFRCLNDKHRGKGQPQAEYDAMNVRASECLHCARCEEVCPQHLHIRELLEAAAGEFESL